MMMDTAVDSDGTAFICPECNFSGTSLPELISHLNEAHSEGSWRWGVSRRTSNLLRLETASKSVAPSRIKTSTAPAEKRSRRKPAFSHQVSIPSSINESRKSLIAFSLFSVSQIVSQATRQSPTLYKQQSQLNHESGLDWLLFSVSSTSTAFYSIDSNDLWTRIANTDPHGTHVHSPFLCNQTDDSSISMISDENANINMNSKAFSNSALVAKRNPNVLHSILSQQRPIAPKNGSPSANKSKYETHGR